MLNRNVKTIRGNKLAYVQNGNGPVLVLLHGFCGSADYWEEVIPFLTSKYQIIAPDLRGHGQSDHPEGPYTIEQIAADLNDLLNELHVENAVVLGHSLGGYTALAFAKLFHSKLKGFGLIHSTAYPDTEEGKKGRDKAIETIQSKGIQTFVDELVPKLFAPSNRIAMQDKLERVKEIGYLTSAEGAIATITAMKNRDDTNEVLLNAEIPILLLAGEEDQIISCEKTFSVQKNNIVHKMLPKSGHMSMYESPQHLAQSINEFMAAF